MTTLRRYAAALRRRFRRATALTDLQQVFTVVYGRPPAEHELRQMEENLGPEHRHDALKAFRTVANGVDHQHNPTAFSIRFAAADVDYVSIEGVELAVDTSDASVSEPIIGGYYEPHLRPFIVGFLEPGMTFVDIGANVGFYSIIAGKAVGPKGRVLSFEPNSENCRLVMLSARRNHIDNITMHPFALGDDRGHALFHTHLGSNGGLVPDVGEALLHPTAVVVPIARLDDIITEKVDLMKIDVEGAEALVVQGAGDLIRNHRPTVVSEFSLEMLRRVSGASGLDYLRFWIDEGYTINRIDRDSHELITIEDPVAYLDGYDDLRLEDLVFIP